MKKIGGTEKCQKDMIFEKNGTSDNFGVTEELRKYENVMISGKKWDIREIRGYLEILENHDNDEKRNI